MSAMDMDIAAVRAVLGTAEYVVDGTSAAFERILASLRATSEALEDAGARAIEAEEAREAAETTLYEERMGEDL